MGQVIPVDFELNRKFLARWHTYEATNKMVGTDLTVSEHHHTEDDECLFWDEYFKQLRKRSA